VCMHVVCMQMPDEMSADKVALLPFLPACNERGASWVSNYSYRVGLF